GRHPAAQRMWTHTMTLRYRRNPGIALTILLSRRQFDRFTVFLHEITPKLISNFWGSLHLGVRHLKQLDWCGCGACHGWCRTPFGWLTPGVSGLMRLWGVARGVRQLCLPVCRLAGGTVGVTGRLQPCRARFRAPAARAGSRSPRPGLPG